MYDQHRWSLKTFIDHLVTAQPEENYAWTTKYRTRVLFEAVTEQEEVVLELQKIPENDETIRQTKLLETICKEMAKFEKPELGLEQVVINEPLDKQHVSGLASRVQSIAPTLWNFLVRIMGPQHPSPRDTSEQYGCKIFMICMMMAAVFSPRNCKKFLITLGIHLHSRGVKRRTLDLLYDLGRMCLINRNKTAMLAKLRMAGHRAKLIPNRKSIHRNKTEMLTKPSMAGHRAKIIPNRKFINRNEIAMPTKLRMASHRGKPIPNRKLIDRNKMEMLTTLWMAGHQGEVIPNRKFITRNKAEMPTRP
ncbi:hypothetical protein N7535_006572 [Penicillium sp. DV-2018c]|nr:hypothetical protein N7461_007344 [Penicillium sp. DV-2018c]KAJ5567266.1 hypothetical protein N7535_006572 [Penicillium sp. DV-2018c]